MRHLLTDKERRRLNQYRDEWKQHIILCRGELFRIIHGEGRCDQEIRIFQRSLRRIQRILKRGWTTVRKPAAA